MINMRRKTASLVGALAIAGSGLGVAGLAATGTSAHADPAFFASKVGVGSDTIQDVFDAYSGADPYPPASNAKYYVPLVSDSASKGWTVSSFDAIPAGGTPAAPGCITTKLNGPAFDRPNGSSNGITALTDSINGTAWQASTGSCTGAAVGITNQIDFARSSRGPKTTGSTLTFIPFARDGVSFAYFDHKTNNIQNLTTAQLVALYSSSTGTITVGADTVDACIMQSGSGTRSFWETALGVTDAQVITAVTASGCGQGSEENNANGAFLTFANGLPSGTDAVIPFSAGSWAAQANGVSNDVSGNGRAAGIALGSIDGTAPLTGSAPNLLPNSAFYGSTTYGRNVFVVVPTTKVSGSLLQKDTALISLFANSTASICSTTAQATANRFGLDSLTAAEGTCGSTATTGNS